MPGNITVNGKYSKYCKGDPLLLDPVRAKKEEEEARRKIRLLQVREQSKKIAAKIRNDVKEAMRKEKQKYEAMKAEEYNCWRHHALQREMNDYRTAIFQVGTAHMAAKNETKMQGEKKKAKQETYKQFRKQMAAKQKGKENVNKPGPCICNKVCANSQFECGCEKVEATKCEKTQKRKRGGSISSDFELSSDDDLSDGTTLNESLTTSCIMPTATTSSACHNRCTQTSLVPSPCTNLKRTPAVLLDVDSCDDSVLVSPPKEIGDFHSEYNQQYCSVRRASPRKTKKNLENKAVQVVRSPCPQSPKKAYEGNKSPDFMKRGDPQPSSRKAPEKRFTLISDLVKKQQNNVDRAGRTSPTRRQQFVSSPTRVHPESRTTSPTKRQQNVPSSSRAPQIQQDSLACPCKTSPTRRQQFTDSTLGVPKKQQGNLERQEKTSPTRRPQFADASSGLSPSRAPRLPTVRPTSSQPISSKVISPRKASVSSKTSQFVPVGQKCSSVAISATSTTTFPHGSSSSTSGRVQFYDYSSKLSRECHQENRVTVNRQTETEQPTAMEKAAIENRLFEDRQQEIFNKNKQMEELGQKALEREQVRRDCNDLTEKLEALTRQYPRQVPTNENTAHVFVDRQLRKEDKMNAAVENILNRPNIITCSEVNQNCAERVTRKQPCSQKTYPNEINVGMASNVNSIPVEDVSSDSCCSILLGYVDDQSRQVRRDLEMWPNKESSEKQLRLRNLLKRLDQMRDSIVRELKSVQCNEQEGKQTSNKEEQLSNLIDCITKCRQEREEIMIDSIVKNKQQGKEQGKQTMRAKAKCPLDEREKELQLKEDLLEKKVREFYNIQKQQTKQTTGKVKYRDEEEECIENKENMDNSSLQTPVEIIITVKGESKRITIPSKTKRNATVKRKPTQLATLIKSPQPSKKLTPKKKPNANKQPSGNVLGRQNSYDSNSTSYMSLPSQIPNDLGNIVDNMEQQMPHSTTTDDTSTSTSNQCDHKNDCKCGQKQPVPPLNPLLAQYIQRLLGMTRNTVQRLGVSSSDIETPSSSIINSTTNMINLDSIVSDERLAFLESFMHDNRSFIQELEQSLRENNHSEIEKNSKAMDDIWRKRLKQQNKQLDIQPKQKTSSNAFSNLKSSHGVQKHSKEKGVKEKVIITETKSKKVIIQNDKEDNLLDQQNSLPSKTPRSKKMPVQQYSKEFNRISQATAKDKSSGPSTDKSDKAWETVRSATTSTTTESDAQITRYAQLTENCTHRIAELTELINRVRQEKQRLLEVTLSSVSDNGRTSTEYLELPSGGKGHSTNETNETSPTSSPGGVQNNKIQNLVTQAPKLSELKKNHHITASQDSGIAESRPITAQENRNDLEPISHTSTESQTTINASQRKHTHKPPAVLRKFSPQFPEDELVHELSTILEVDTPANSRINTAICQPPSEDLPTSAADSSRQPVLFPTFVEYCRQLNLDITRLDAEQSAQLQQEFTYYLEDIQNTLIQQYPQYKEYPSINAFTQDDHEAQVTIEEKSVDKMRIKNIQFECFPNVKEYVQQQRPASSCDDPTKMLDTASLDNITDLPTNTNSDNDSGSIDIEEELKRRNILKKSFRYRHILSSTANPDAEFYNEVMAAESGVEKLSTSDNTVSYLAADMKKLVMQWPNNLGLPSQASCSTSTKEDASKSTTLEDSANEIGRPLNLRAFLKRELLKHANLSESSSTSSSDFSLRSQFLFSLLETLTPGAASKSGQQTLERQKTSTPVAMQSTRTHTTHSNNPSHASSSQLFSGESRISSVHMNERSHRLHNTSEGVNGDQSSN